MHSVGGAIGIGGVLPQNSVGGSFAFGKEFVTDGGLENWTDDTPDDWLESEESAGVRDITKETTEIHGGSAAVKLEATNSDGTIFDIYQNITLQIGSYYVFTGWYHFASRTAGFVTALVYNATDGAAMGVSSYDLTGDYTYFKTLFIRTVASNLLRCRFQSETTTGIVYFDDISVRDVDLIARRYGGTLIGAIGMQQIDLWDKWNTN